MHYRILAIVDEESGDLDKLLMPYGDGREWDFYQVGGRFTGAFDRYDPTKEPANIEACQHHQGAECVHCKGTGQVTKWPTQWVPHAGDSIPVSGLTELHVKQSHAIVCSYGWFGTQRWIPWHAAEEPGFVDQATPSLGWIQKTFPKGMAIVVDCHN